VAEEPVSAGELTALHARISIDLAELRRRLRPPAVAARADAIRHPARVARAAVETLRAVRAAPGVAARVGVAFLVVAGVAALLARGRLSGHGEAGYNEARRD
jgi:hypothetical protein